jgi:hypothetical protein
MPGGRGQEAPGGAAAWSHDEQPRRWMTSRKAVTDRDLNTSANRRSAATGVRCSHPVARAELAHRVPCAPGRQLSFMCYGGDREAPGPGALRRDEWVRDLRLVAEPVARCRHQPGPGRACPPAGAVGVLPRYRRHQHGFGPACFRRGRLPLRLNPPARGDAIVRGENESPNRSGIEKHGSPGRT